MIKQVDRPRWRLLSQGPASGYSHMALDQALLESATSHDFQPTLRFLRWSPPGLSIGRFQDIHDIDIRSCAACGIEIVRRPTGGKCILHRDDFTYSLVLPSGSALPEGIVEAYIFICGGIIAALGRLGLQTTVQSKRKDDYSHMGGACFTAVTSADLEYQGRKICGSAQVRHRGALLQHGTLLMIDRSDVLFELLSHEREEARKHALESFRKRCISLDETGLSITWSDLAGAFIEAFSAYFDVVIEEGNLTEEEKTRWHELEIAYGSPQWLSNGKANEHPAAGKATCRTI